MQDAIPNNSTTNTNMSFIHIYYDCYIIMALQELSDHRQKTPLKAKETV